MSDMPDEIWLDHKHKWWVSLTPEAEVGHHGTRYIRADLDAAKRKELVEAVRTADRGRVGATLPSKHWPNGTEEFAYVALPVNIAEKLVAYLSQPEAE
jgi:hypothetical protein